MNYISINVRGFDKHAGGSCIPWIHNFYDDCTSISFMRKVRGDKQRMAKGVHDCIFRDLDVKLVGDELNIVACYW